MSYQYTFKKASKLVNFCVVILILKMEENMQHFQHIMLYYFKKGKNTSEMQKIYIYCAVYGEDSVTDCMCQKSSSRKLRNFVLEVPHWTMPHGWVDQLKLIAIKSRH